MTAYERQIQETEAFYDLEMSALEDEEIEILSSDISDSRLHEILHNPDEEGIAEG